MNSARVHLGNGGGRGGLAPQQCYGRLPPALPTRQAAASAAPALRGGKLEKNLEKAGKRGSIYADLHRRALSSCGGRFGRSQVSYTPRGLDLDLPSLLP